jgi:hypothetical protein
MPRKSPCAVDGCGCPTMARGWCRHHYNKWYYSYGGPVNGAPATRHRPADQPCGCFCIGCGAHFVKVDSRGRVPRFCSTKCGQRFRKARRRWGGHQVKKRTSQPAGHVCRGCGTHFVAPHYRGCAWRQYCSRRCRRAAEKRQMTVRRYEGGKYRVRARRWGVPYEPIKNLDILERDGWVCGICASRIWKHAKCPHPKSPSMDHIVPMSRGGGHVRANVQAAHYGCNAHKGAGSVGSQLLLVG